MAWPKGKPKSEETKYRIKLNQPKMNGNTYGRTRGYVPAGMYRHPLYHTYVSMYYRCYRQTDKDYKYVGALGIKMCERWTEQDGQGFLNFIADMGPRPDKAILIRIDMTENYSKENCFWKT